MIHQDARIMRRNFLPGDQDEITINSGRGHWLQVISGDISLESESEKHNLKSGDGVAIEAIEKYSIHSLAESDLLLFDLA